MKIYYVAGETSGDLLASWHAQNQRPEATIRGVGGTTLAARGAALDLTVDQLSCTGFVEVLTNLWRLRKIQKQIVGWIMEWQPDEVVLVNFSSFNLALAKLLKAAGCAAPITFFSPPQLWVWGAWRAKKLAARVDRIEVIFPFEVAWYHARGITAHYVGSPIFESVADVVPVLQHKSAIICLPGSRLQEIKRLLPTFLRALSLMRAKFPRAPLAIFCSSIAHKEIIMQAAHTYDLLDIAYIVDPEEQKEWRQRAAVALTKPGTNTLELALCGVPAVVAYKVPWLTYWLGRLVTSIKWMSLPSLLLQQEVYPEFIQGNFCVEKIFDALSFAYRDACDQGPRMLRIYNVARELRRQFENAQPISHLSKTANADKIQTSV